MNEEQFGGRRRSTRAQKPPESSSGDPSGGASGGDGAKSRLADGVRSSPTASNVSGTTQPQAPSGQVDKANSPNVSAASNGPSGVRGKGEDNKTSDSNDGKGEKGTSEDKGKSTEQAGKSKVDAFPKVGETPASQSGESSKPKTLTSPYSSSDRDKGKGNKDEKQPKEGNFKNGPVDGDETKGQENNENSSGESSEGIGDKTKNLGSNATGVDYSGKNKKDQLEHQAADVAMDATPGLSQFNSARKALKNFNKKKKDAGMKDDGITDKAEEVADKAVDTGIKGVKVAAGAGAASAVGSLGMAGLVAMKMLMMLKGLVLTALSNVAGFFGSIFSAVSSFFSGLLGVGAAVANTIAAGVSALVIGAAGVLGFGAAEEISKKDDSMLSCVPAQTSVEPATQTHLESGEIDAVKEDNAIKLWSVYASLGGTKEKTAAVLGNFEHESGVDPTSIETIYDEPFQIGPKKQFAIDSDFLVDIVAPSYGYDAITHMGIGLAQWTNGRNRLLIDYAEEKGAPWYQFDTQMLFMIEGDEDYRQDQLMDFITGSGDNVDEETDKFKRGWIGNNNNTLGVRQAAAHDYMFILERATADTDYADSILSGINVERSQGNHAAGAYHQDDGCGNPIKIHYANQAADGTGEVPADLSLVPWSRETLPDSLKEFAKNPEDAGLTWGNSTGWAGGILPDQCVALSTSYFMQLYPDWNKDGRATTRPFGNGKDTAGGWANHYGESTVDYPSAGAVFSDSSTSVWGHTGIVQHVFANGDILINEQNVRGVSGEGAGIKYSWNWRVIKKDRYEQSNWEFFKPVDAEPQWSSTAI